MGRLTLDAHRAAHRNDLHTMYKIVKQLAGKSAHGLAGGQGEDGEMITAPSHVADRWVRHFASCLNGETMTKEQAEQRAISSSKPRGAALWSRAAQARSVCLLEGNTKAWQEKGLWNRWDPW